MKKLLAILLALMLMPASALAQSEAEKYFGVDLSGMNSTQLELIISECDKVADLAKMLKAEAQQQLAETKDASAAPSEIEAAFKAIGDSMDNAWWVYESVSQEGDSVHVNVRYSGSNVWSDSIRLCYAVIFSIDFQSAAFSGTDCPKIIFRFIEIGRDQYGHPFDVVTITMCVTRARSAQLDLEYFRSCALVSQLHYLKAIDGYYLHQAYEAVAK